MYLWKAPEFYQNNDIYITATGLEALFPTSTVQTITADQKSKKHVVLHLQ